MYKKKEEKNIAQTLLYIQKSLVYSTRILVDKLYWRKVEFVAKIKQNSHAIRRHMIRVIRCNFIVLSNTHGARFEFVEAVQARKTRELSKLADSLRSVAKSTFVQSTPSLSRSQGRRWKSHWFRRGTIRSITGDVDKREGRRQNIYPTSNMVEWIASGVAMGVERDTRRCARNVVYLRESLVYTDDRSPRF